MEEHMQNKQQPQKPRRRKKSQLQIFKEAYLPAVIGCVALLLILVFIIGSISRGIQRSKFEAQTMLEASIAEANRLSELAQEASTLSEIAKNYAQQFDYENAVITLDSFTGDLSAFPEIAQKRAEYEEASAALIKWDDVNQVLNLSFQLLIADPDRAFNDDIYGSSYNRNFVTTEEFTKILQQLYANGYILIRTSDITSGTQAKDLYLPQGKKPLIITQTQVNYNTYMTDGDGDKIPDKDGDGFASKLILDANGNLSCEMVDSTGQTLTGAYDLVPILESFIATHPDFSYKGARAILALTGYDGLFGYRTNASALSVFGSEKYDEEIRGANNVIAALRDTGYEFACYTYENVAYGSLTSNQIQADLDKWNAEVTPILGSVNMLVYAKNSDISGSSAGYSGEKFTVLQNFGFTHYLGFSTDGNPWFETQEEYVRQGRLMVTGTNLITHPQWFAELFDAASILSANRPELPA